MASWLSPLAALLLGALHAAATVLPSPFLTVIADPLSGVAPQAGMNAGVDLAISNSGLMIVLAVPRYLAPATTMGGLPVAAGFRGALQVYRRATEDSTSLWTLVSTLVPPIYPPYGDQSISFTDGGANAVKISANGEVDGEVIVAGADGAGLLINGTEYNYGAVYTWVLTAGVYVAQQRLTHPLVDMTGKTRPPTTNPTFGRNVAISDDFQTLVVSSYLASSTVVVYAKNTNTTQLAAGIFWVVAAIQPADGYAANSNVLVRTRMVMSRDGRSVINAYYIDGNVGRVSIYALSAAGSKRTLSFVQTLRAPGNITAVTESNFGIGLSTSLNGLALALGAPTYNGDAIFSGAVFVYSRNSSAANTSGNQFQLVTALGASNANGVPVRADAQCGWPLAMSMDGASILSGCPAAPVSPGSRISIGGVSVLRLAAGSWSETAFVTPADLPVPSSFPDSLTCLISSCNQAAFGAAIWTSSEPAQVFNVGAAYFATFDGSLPPPLQKAGKRLIVPDSGAITILASSAQLTSVDNAASSDALGYLVAASGDGTIVAAVLLGREPGGAIAVFANLMPIQTLTLPLALEAAQPLALALAVSRATGSTICAVSNAQTNGLGNAVFTWTRATPGGLFALDAAPLTVSPPAGQQLQGLFFNDVAVSGSGQTLVTAWAATSTSGAVTNFVSVFSRAGAGAWTAEAHPPVTDYKFTEWTNFDSLGIAGVSLSADGLTLAAASNTGGRKAVGDSDGYVVLWSRPSESSAFVFKAALPLGLTVPEASLGWPLVISADGGTVAAYLNPNLVAGRVVTWTQSSAGVWPAGGPSAVLNVSDPTIPTSDGSFGTALSLSSDGTTLLVGAYLNDVGGSLSGLAAVFTRPPNTATGSSVGNWSLVSLLLPPSGSGDGVSFGSGLALISSSRAVIGAPGGGLRTEGALYLWQPNGAPPAAASNVALVAGLSVAAIAGIAAVAAVVVLVLGCRREKARRDRVRSMRNVMGSTPGIEAAFGAARSKKEFDKVGEY